MGRDVTIDVPAAVMGARSGWENEEEVEPDASGTGGGSEPREAPGDDGPG